MQGQSFDGNYYNACGYIRQSLHYHDQAKGNAAVIDPGGNGEDILNKIYRNLELKYILLTHGHFDHIDAVGWLKDKTGAKLPFIKTMLHVWWTAQ